MTEPTTPNLGLIVPNTGDLVGAWGTAALNPDLLFIDGVLGGVQTFSMAGGTTITLTTATGATLTPTAGPVGSANALIVFTGMLSANSSMVFGQPGRYTVWNKCSGNNNNAIFLSPSNGTGITICAPPGQKCSVFFDGTNMDYVDLPAVGSYMDLAAGSIPPWIANSSVAPWLPCNGSTFNVSQFPALAEILGSTFGGNGITTFGVPDAQSRVMMPLDLSATGRISTAVAGFSGAVLGATGGDQNTQQHTHTAAVTDPGHTHDLNNGANVFVNVAGVFQFTGSNVNIAPKTITVVTATTGITVSNSATFSGASGNVQPSIVGGMRFIKT